MWQNALRLCLSCIGLQSHIHELGAWDWANWMTDESLSKLETVVQLIYIIQFQFQFLQMLDYSCNIHQLMSIKIKLPTLVIPVHNGCYMGLQVTAFLTQFMTSSLSQAFRRPVFSLPAAFNYHVQDCRQWPYILPSFPGLPWPKGFCILQPIKTWKRGRPGNEANHIHAGFTCSANAHKPIAICVHLVFHKMTTSN